MRSAVAEECKDPARRARALAAAAAGFVRLADVARPLPAAGGEESSQCRAAVGVLAAAAAQDPFPSVHLHQARCTAVQLLLMHA